MPFLSPPSQAEPVGYGRLIQDFSLKVVPARHTAWVADRGTGGIVREGDQVRRVFAPSFRRPSLVGDQLEFALKYEGVELAVLDALFARIPATEIEAMVHAKPTGRYVRQAWFLYEWLTGDQLSLPDLTQGNYVDVLDSKTDHVAEPRRVPRQRVRNNLLGTPAFCPRIRRTNNLNEFGAANLEQRCHDIVAQAEPELLSRATSYLFQKETKSTFAIERETPEPSRGRRFIAALMRGERDDFLTFGRLVELQNQIVDERFAEPGYRTIQNYVGQKVGWAEEKIHYVCPRPEDVPGLMEGLIAAQARLIGVRGPAAAIAHAAAVAFGFVYIHPFEDGNGRIHRFLVHNVLARRGFTPPGLVLPVSAAMVNNPKAYDVALEAFSRPLMEHVDYELDDLGAMTVDADTARLYRFPDLTPQTEALAKFVRTAIEDDLVRELDFLRRYDATRDAVRDVVDLPDRLLGLVLNLLRQNGGTLSARKRTAHFDMLTDDEVRAMEQAFDAAGGNA